MSGSDQIYKTKLEAIEAAIIQCKINFDYSAETFNKKVLGRHKEHFNNWLASRKQLSLFYNGN